LALEVLNNPTPHLFLAESNADTRRELRRQLAEFDPPTVILKNDMLEFAAATALGTTGPLVALVDPFFETEAQWQKIWSAASHAAALLRAPDAPGMMLVFNWRKTKMVSWPNAPKGFKGPIATITRPTEKGEAFYHLAVYATELVTAQAEDTMRNIGWNWV
jgi:hypothetical protein